jgi:hypothetical protein
MDVRRMRGVSSCNRCGRGAPAPRRGRQQGAQAASVEVCDVRGAARRGAPPSAVLPGRGPPCAAHPALPGAVRRSRGWGASARRTWHCGAARCARHPAPARATAPAPSMPAGLVHATRRSAMRSQRGRARAPRLETDALNNRDRHRRAQPLPGRAPALAALQSQWAVLPTRHGCARRGIRGTLIRKSYLFFLPEQRYPAVLDKAFQLAARRCPHPIFLDPSNPRKGGGAVLQAPGFRV